MEFKGTKGIWIVAGNTEGGILISNKNYNRDIATVWKYDNDFLERQEASANAKLIAQAPDMLSMLQNLLDNGDKMFSNGEPSETYFQLLNKTQELIKKATS
jgi:hypothetical protein